MLGGWSRAMIALSIIHSVFVSPILVLVVARVAEADVKVIIVLMVAMAVISMAMVTWRRYSICPSPHPSAQVSVEAAAARMNYPLTRDSMYLSRCSGVKRVTWYLNMWATTLLRRNLCYLRQRSLMPLL
jgi:hypothetical protein